MRDDEKAAPMRMLFELDRKDNPRLYDELSKFRQGPKRVGRLRTLAHEGLWIEQMQSGWTVRATEPTAPKPGPDEIPPLDEKSSEIMNGMFESPITE
jgi:hypothetical protein